MAGERILDALLHRLVLGPPRHFVIPRVFLDLSLAVGFGLLGRVGIRRGRRVRESSAIHEDKSGEDAGRRRARRFFQRDRPDPLPILRSVRIRPGRLIRPSNSCGRVGDGPSKARVPISNSSYWTFAGHIFSQLRQPRQ